jgi:hypothetical protein
MAIRSKEDLNSRPKKAMRQFSYTPPKTKSSIAKAIETYFDLLLPALTFLCISLTGIWAGYQYHNTSNTSNTISTRKQVARTSSSPKFNKKSVELSSLKQFIETKAAMASANPTMMRATGTYSNENGMHIFTGTFDFAGNGTFEIDRVKSTPLEFKNSRLTNKVSPVFETDVAVIEAFVNAIQDPFLTRDQSINRQLTTLESTKFMGIEAYKVHIKSDDITLIIKASDYSLIERNHTSANTPNQHYRYSEYRTVAGICFPFTIAMTNRLGQSCRVNLNSLKAENDSHDMATLSYTDYRH